MENKYFTPDIEDLHIGYELEVNYNFKFNDVFHKIIIDSFEELSDIHSRMSGNCVIRVPYLTKEQIEAEGWIPHGQGNDNGIVYSLLKNSFRIAIWRDSLKIQIQECEGNILFEGHCKDINTFRKICKLLGI